MAMLRSVTIEDQERLIGELWAAWSAHDMERLLALFTEDLLYEQEEHATGEKPKRPTKRRRQ